MTIVCENNHSAKKLLKSLGISFSEQGDKIIVGERKANAGKKNKSNRGKAHALGGKRKNNKRKDLRGGGA